MIAIGPARKTVLVALLLALSGAAGWAQSERPVPAEARDALRQANLALDQIRGSNLEPWWRANAEARISRTLATMRDAATARTIARDAVADLGQDNQSKPPPAFSAPAVYAVLAQAYAALADGEATRAVADLAERDLDGLPDAGLRATLASYLALARIAVADRPGAQADILRGLKAAAAAPVDRGRVAALALAALAQARMGQREAAAATITAAKASLAGIGDPIGTAVGSAALARASAVNGDGGGARALVQDAVGAFNRAPSDTPPTQKASALAQIAQAEGEIGDRINARQSSATLRQYAGGMTNPYERCIAFLLLADVLIQLPP